MDNVIYTREEANEITRRFAEGETSFEDFIDQAFEKVDLHPSNKVSLIKSLNVLFNAVAEVDETGRTGVKAVARAYTRADDNCAYKVSISLKYLPENIPPAFENIRRIAQFRLIREFLGQLFTSSYTGGVYSTVTLYPEEDQTRPSEVLLRSMNSTASYSGITESVLVMRFSNLPIHN